MEEESRGETGELGSSPGQRFRQLDTAGCPCGPFCAAAATSGGDGGSARMAEAGDLWLPLRVQASRPAGPQAEPRRL